MTGKVWFITGSSKGFGRIWAEAALAHGDRVAATARDPGTLAELVGTYGDRVAALALDVTDKAAVGAVVAEAQGRFGRLDVVVNNAGYGQFGAIEEISEAEARAQIETNVFGALWVTQAALPVDAGAGVRAHRADLVDRRGQRLSQRRDVPRVEMGTVRNFRVRAMTMGRKETLAWHDAKPRSSRTSCSTSSWPAVIRKSALAGTAWSTS